MKWRNYFKGTLAHNTLRINGADQAQVGGPTMWKEHYQCSTLKVEENADVELVTASHDGYQHFGVHHTRTVEFHRITNTFIIEDSLECQDDTLVEFPLHLHPNVQVEQINEHTYILTQSNMRLVRLELDGKFKLNRFKGSEDPVLGWFSPAFYVKHESESLLQASQSKGFIRFKTKITVES